MFPKSHVAVIAELAWPCHEIEGVGQLGKGMPAWLLQLLRLLGSICLWRSQLDEAVVW
jgi:hypothetical protein